MSLLTNLRAYWKLDESSGNASDSSGNSYTLTNTNSVNYNSGKINNSANFGNSNTNKRLSINSKLGITPASTNISISVWVKINTQPSSGEGQSIAFLQLLSNPGGSGTRYFNRLIYQNAGGTYYLNNFRTGGYYAQTLTTGTWYHIVQTVDGSNNCKTYLNGTLLFSGTGSDQAAHGGTEQDYFSIGNVTYYNSSGGLFEWTKGEVDEVGVWSRELTSTEVTQLYNSGNGLAYPLDTNYELTANTGTFNITGNNATLVKNSVQLSMTAETAQFNLTGYDAGSKLSYNIIPDTLEFNLTWEDIRVLAPTTFSVDTGNFIFTGNDAQLEYRIHNYLLTADRADFFLTGNNVQFKGQKWQNITKNTQATFSNNSKSVATYANISKNTETFTNIDKS